MKHMKKFVSLALALMMALALCVPAMAAEGETTDPHPGVADITINVDPGEGTEKGETYTVYKIFSATVGTENENQPIVNPTGTGSTFENVSYTIDSSSPFFNAVKNFKNGENNVFTLEQVGDTTTYVVLRNQMKNEAGEDVDVPFDAADLATELKKVIDNPNVDLDSVRVVNGEKSGFTVENTGYYLIISSLGSKMIVDTIGKGDMTIKTKNSLPTLEKKILVPKPANADGTVPEGYDKVDSATESYGDTVTFELAVYIPATAVGEMVVHDRMDSNLTYVGLTEDSLKVAVSDGDETGEGVTACTKHFTISAEQVAAAIKEIQAGEEGITVYIRYTATLNSDAPTATAIKNIANLTYSQYKTPDDEVEVYTYKFDLVKTDKENKLLTGAKFELYDAKEGGNKIGLVKNEDGTYRVATPEEIAVEGFVSAVIEAGNVEIKGLSNGTYWLEETEAPAGYNKLTERTEVKIENADLDATVEANEWVKDGVHVINNTGSELPSTGGIGTTIFYVVGGILVAGAAILLMTRKRVSEDD